VTTRLAALLQGGYFVLTGVWPLINMASFEAVTGPKTDDWLVHTVGVLVIVIGLALVAGSLKSELPAPVVVLAIGSSAGLAAVEFFYVLRGVIWPIYMLDAVGELGLIGLWAAALFRGHTARAGASITPGMPTQIRPTM
jgi:hypothetical protein